MNYFKIVKIKLFKICELSSINDAVNGKVETEKNILTQFPFIY